MRQDLRHALRLLFRRPAVCALVVATLALGIAAATIVFSLADAIAWHPLPFKNADRLVRVTGASMSTWPARDQVFDGVYPFGLDSGIVQVGSEALAATTCWISSGTLEALGVAPVWGRGFAADEFRVDSGVVIVGADTWRRVLSQGDVAHPTLLFEGARYAIVGVMPESFDFPVGRVQVWRPRATTAPALRTALGVLRPDVAVAAAQALARTTTTTPNEPARTVRISPFVDVDPTTSIALRLLIGAAGMVLLIAIANAANVLLADAIRRQSDLAIRAALGATWPRLARQLVAETLLMSAFAVVVALFLSKLALDALVKGVPYLMSFQTLRPIALDWRALIFAAISAIVAGLGAAGISVFRARRIGTEVAVRAQTSGLQGQTRSSQVLTMVQVAVTLALLATAAVLGSSLHRLSRLDPGFSPAHVVELVVQVPTWHFTTDESSRAAFDALRDEAAHLPGVVSATVSHAMPPSLGSRAMADLDAATPLGDGTVWSGYADATFFSTLGIPLVEGRTFDSRDRAGTQPVAVISRALADRLSPNGGAVGQRFRESKTAPWLTVVGVVGNVAGGGIEANAAGPSSTYLAYYVAREQLPTWWYEGLIVRTAPSPDIVIPDLRALIQRAIPGGPIIEVRTADETIANVYSRVRFALGLLSTLSGVALVLALVGVYGAFSYAVRQRTREIGLRMALGAAPAQVLRMVLGTSLRITLVGLSLGVPLAMIATRALTSFVFGASANNPLLFVGIAGAILLAAIGATYAPARRAARIDPLKVLRQI